MAEATAAPPPSQNNAEKACVLVGISIGESMGIGTCISIGISAYGTSSSFGSSTNAGPSVMVVFVVVVVCDRISYRGSNYNSIRCSYWSWR